MSKVQTVREQASKSAVFGWISEAVRREIFQQAVVLEAQTKIGWSGALIQPYTELKLSRKPKIGALSVSSRFPKPKISAGSDSIGKGTSKVGSSTSGAPKISEV